jgi:hypothetical protein
VKREEIILTINGRRKMRERGTGRERKRGHIVGQRRQLGWQIEHEEDQQS